MKQKSILSIHDLDEEDIITILDLAKEFEKDPKKQTLNGEVVASIFYEPSTRTRLSFESAISRIGGRVIGFSDPGSSSVKKGESLRDTILMLDKYSDLIVLRHQNEGSARYASEVSSKPIINAGDGANQHPTQTLLDLYSIRETQGKLDNLTIVVAGDLRYGRTAHSLVIALSNFNSNFIFVSPEELRMPKNIKFELDRKGIKYEEQKDLGSALKTADILYMTRVQKERFTEAVEFEQIKKDYVLTLDMLENTKENLKVLHPLPRVWEIDADVDNSEKAYYFKQAENGVYVRQALITLLLNKNE